MKVFISWSGEKSKQVAEWIDTWLQCTIQSSDPWLSSRSIDRGATWFTEIMNELSDTSIGIICLTKENKDKPWILFEAGAIAKGLSSNRVCTFLIDLEPIDLVNPLAQFNHTLYNRESLLQLLMTINNLSESPLKPFILEKVFDKYWSEFQERFNQILATNAVPIENTKRDEEDVLSEVLNVVRSLDKRINRIEEQDIRVKTSISFADRQRTLDMTNRLASMIIRGEKLEDVRNIAAQPGFTDAEVKAMIANAINLANAKNTQPVSNDMLEQLKVKFGK